MLSTVIVEFSYEAMVAFQNHFQVSILKRCHQFNPNIHPHSLVQFPFGGVHSTTILE